MSAGWFFTGQTATAAGPKTYTSVATKSTLPAGTSATGITVTNTSRNNIAFNAINLTVPSGLVVVPASVTLDPSDGSANLNGDKIELRNLSTSNVSPKNKITVNFSVTAQLQASCASYTFTSDVRQSNDFNGTKDKFVLEGADATMTGPCSSAVIHCVADDNVACATGTIYSPNGDTASVVVNDSDGVTATLTASVAAGALQCPEYTATSDLLQFGITTAQNLTGLTKTVTFTQPETSPPKEAWQYEACFQAPYDFPALLPSQLDRDFANGDFSGNTTLVSAGPPATYKGLLLPCSAGHLVPCLESRTISAGIVNLTVTAPALDPGMRF